MNKSSREEDGFKNWITLKNKYRNTCSVCLSKVKVGEVIDWNTKTKLVRHQKCSQTSRFK